MKITEQIDAALVEVTAAEGALEALLRDLNAGIRAEKVKVSEAVEGAFTRLRNSRMTLSKLREELAELDEKK
jgi:hypothetical protein